MRCACDICVSSCIGHTYINIQTMLVWELFSKKVSNCIKKIDVRCACDICVSSCIGHTYVNSQTMLVWELFFNHASLEKTYSHYSSFEKQLSRFLQLIELKRIFLWRACRLIINKILNDKTRKKSIKV
jgi:hypothetical protein